MPRAIRIARHGGPEVLEWVDVRVDAPGPGEALVRHTAIGLNFVDVYQRTGLYPNPLPLIPGGEGAGVVEALGEGVDGFAVGDRVVYTAGTGAYAEVRLVPAARLVKLPEAVDERTAAACFLKGTTAQFLLRRTFKVAPGQTILLHAAAGGVGQIACQWAKALGATVIGTVGGDEKMAIAARNGCHYVINYRSEDFVARVREITAGEGVDVVYDSVGNDTFPGSLDCLKPLGMFVSFGNSSGLVPPFPMRLLQQKGSLFATRPTSAHYLARRSDLDAAAAELFAMLASGSVRVEIGRTFALKDAANAHRALESRGTVGPSILLP